MPSSIDFNLHKDAIALRPVRIVNFKNRDPELRLYTAITFSNDTWKGCRLYLRRCFLSGRPEPHETDLLINVLNDDGDIIQDFPITKRCFEYLRRTMKFVVDQ